MSEIVEITVNEVTDEVNVQIIDSFVPNPAGSVTWGGILGTLSDQTDLQEALDTKVDKVDGKGLSTEDYTTAEKNKLAGIAAGATVNDTDANLKNRANHTGTQLAETISDFQATVSANTDVAANTTARHTHSNITILNAITEAFTTALKTAYDAAVTWISTNGANLINHLSNTSNPHSVTKDQVGLGNADNTSDANKPVSVAQQAALDLKAPLAGPTFSGSITGSYLTASELLITNGSKNIVSAPVATYPSLAELIFLKGVTSALQAQIDAKAPSTAPTFATSITGSYLTASEIVITDGSKKIVSAPVATYPNLTELSYVKGVTSAIQTQINDKETYAAATTGSQVSFVTKQIYNSPSSPSTSNITDDLTNAKIGVVQKIYHNNSTPPTFPAGWVRIGTGNYVINTLNIIYAEWVSGTRVEFWVSQPA